MKASRLEQANEALRHALAHIQGRRGSDIAYGLRARTVGCIVSQSSYPEHWLKIRMARTDEIDRRYWDGELLSANFEGVYKPRIYGHFDWEANGFSYRAIMMSLVRGIISKTPSLDFPPPLELQWWAQLTDALHKIQAISTDRIRFPDDDVAGMLKERFGIDLKVPLPLQQTAHTDLHWANLAAPELSIIDWEGWGQAPYGFDVAHLHVYSILQKEMVAKLKDVFSAIMARPEYDIAFLFVASDLMRLYDLRGMYPLLQPELRREAQQIFKLGRIKEFCL